MIIAINESDLVIFNEEFRTGKLKYFVECFWRETRLVHML